MKRTRGKCPRVLDKKLSGSCGNRNDLAPLVKSARRANPVRNVGSCALRAHAELGQSHHAVIRAALTLAAFRRFSFGYAHKSIIQLNFSLSNSAQVDGSCLDSPELVLFFALPNSLAGKPRHSASHNGCCGNSRRISSRM